ncbi:hypothetical protein GN958_ATG13967 [Phytophthora infestans]|uniref:Uncharacterized protein n=1 Tax=Phytophthora infestans TaxID=4787 RepID=A0A8S9UEN2_PHYIN|nr:hypothetical protein GN958_ATG13967 [Phytophthora infestans]
MEGVSTFLQHSTLMKSGSRRPFDRVVSEYHELKRLDPSAPIVNNPTLESGIVKLQPLPKAERATCAISACAIRQSALTLKASNSWRTRLSAIVLLGGKGTRTTRLYRPGQTNVSKGFRR